MGKSPVASGVKKSHRRATGFDAGAAMLRAQIKTLPSQPGVYRMIGKNGTPLYIGKAKDLKKRVTSYTQRARLPVRLQRMVSLAQTLEITVTHHGNRGFAAGGQFYPEIPAAFQHSAARR